MDQAKIEDTIKELAIELVAKTQCRLQKPVSLARMPQKSNRTIEKSVDTLQESLDFLRVCIKYQAYDLEATRRENQYLRRLLEGQD